MTDVLSKQDLQPKKLRLCICKNETTSKKFEDKLHTSTEDED